MAVFKAPRITTIQREGLVLEVSEIVFDTTQNRFYGGNGVSTGGFPIGQGLAGNLEIVTLNQNNIDNKSLTLATPPSNPNSIILTPEGGPPQRVGIDFEVVGTVISWDNLGLDSFLEVNETVIIQY
jgi:hypothetical protein